MSQSTILFQKVKEAQAGTAEHKELLGEYLLLLEEQEKERLALKELSEDNIRMSDKNIWIMCAIVVAKYKREFAETLSSMDVQIKELNQKNKELSIKVANNQVILERLLE